MQSLELSLAQAVGLARQQSAEVSAAMLLAQVQQAIANKGPNLMVAASDAPPKERAWADALCDGTDDDVEIQTALDGM